MEPQAVWAVIAGVLILALGVFLFCRPEAFWRLTEQWKSYRADEPSGLYRISTKFGGICFMAAPLCTRRAWYEFPSAG